MNVSAMLERAVAGRWVAGYYPQDAINRTRLFNSKGVSTMINFLGEETHDPSKVRGTVRTYLHIIDELKRQRLNAAISVKPTQIGLRISHGLMHYNYVKIASKAKAKGIFVWLDMETPDCVDPTIEEYKTLIGYGNTGICIQAYLKRSLRDALGLIEDGATIRLVKGAYRANEEVSYRAKRPIDANYMRIMRKLFLKGKRFMIATHDSWIINEARRLNRKYKRNVTFGMLNGIRNGYALYLARSGEKVAAYVPFGGDWFGYGLRRITEQRHLSLIMRSLFEKQEI